MELIAFFMSHLVALNHNSVHTPGGIAQLRNMLGVRPQKCGFVLPIRWPSMADNYFRIFGPLFGRCTESLTPLRPPYPCDRNGPSASIFD
jgi:hypothetical protein